VELGSVGGRIFILFPNVKIVCPINIILLLLLLIIIIIIISIIIVVVIIIIILVIIFMQGIYNYIPETNNASRV